MHVLCVYSFLPFYMVHETQTEAQRKAAEDKKALDRPGQEMKDRDTEAKDAK